MTDISGKDIGRALAVGVAAAALSPTVSGFLAGINTFLPTLGPIDINLSIAIGALVLGTNYLLDATGWLR